MLRRIVAQCDTGEVKVVDKDGNDEQIIDLTKKAYHWVRPPKKSALEVAPSTDPAVVAKGDEASDDEFLELSPEEAHF